jgi:hypothetical protein
MMATKKKFCFEYGAVNLFMFVTPILEFSCTVSDTWLHQHSNLRQLY